MEILILILLFCIYSSRDIKKNKIKYSYIIGNTYVNRDRYGNEKHYNSSGICIYNKDYIGNIAKYNSKGHKIYSRDYYGNETYYKY